MALKFKPGVRKSCAFFGVLTALYFGIVAGTGTTGTVKHCTGLCTRDPSDCKINGGSVIGFCENGTSCCDFSRRDMSSCGVVKSGRNPFHFVSPEYPAYISKDIICTIGLTLAEDVVAIRIDFIDVLMDGVGYAPHAAVCESDMFFFKGFKTWTPPPFCGNLTGYGTILERTVNQTKMDQLTIVALMSSQNYRWKLRVTPITRNMITRNFGANPRHQHMDPRKRFPGVPPRRRRSIPDVELMNEGGSEDVIDTLERPLISNGRNATSVDAPWQASLRVAAKNETIDNETTAGPDISATTMSPSELQSLEAKRKCMEEDGLHFCGGSIITDRHILTAAHCFYATNKAVDFLPLSDIRVVLGDTNRCSKEPTNGQKQEEYEIETVLFHYAYDPVTIMNDIAVIKLKRSINFRQNIQIIKMAPPTSRKTEFEGQRAYVSGWGMTNLTTEEAVVSEAPYILQSSYEFLIRNQSECMLEQARHVNQVPDLITLSPRYANYFDSYICTDSVIGSGAVHVGQGDSGGPLVIRKNGQNALVGVVSHAIPNENNTLVEEPMDFFVFVPFYYNWVRIAVND